jgi:hypothetical protein
VPSTLSFRHASTTNATSALSSGSARAVGLGPSGFVACSSFANPPRCRASAFATVRTWGEERWFSSSRTTVAFG